MTLEHLNFFATVAQCGSINKAAQILHISQPHLSCIIRDIENDVGITLLERTKQGVILTPDGENFLKHSNAIIIEMAKLKGLSRKHEPGEDRLNISMTRYSHTMDSFIHICRQNQSLDHFTYRLNEGTTVEVIDEVASGLASVGIIHYTSGMAEEVTAMADEKNLKMQSIAILNPQIVISKSHELIRNNKNVTISNLRAYGFARYIGQYEDLFYIIATENHQTDLNELSKIAYVHGRASLLHLISSSNFYTIGIGEFATQNSMYGILSIPIENCTEKLVFAIATQKDAVLTKSALAFIDDLTKRYQRMEITQSSSYM
ncbi:MAG: LysR family transcriptional regulator [Treponema sp.]|jgi:DNA-binding transcriptional LysR family regulator|nr:LysR family transcriptional regulator [Treponema sp.]